MAVNLCILLGNLTGDPELRTFDSGRSVCNFDLATESKWTSQDGEKKKATQFHKIVVWGKLAENCGKYLEKGRSVYLEGEIRYEQYEKDGATRYVTKIVAHEVKFLGVPQRREGEF